jgi:hypothetical protein
MRVLLGGLFVVLVLLLELVGVVVLGKSALNIQTYPSTQASATTMYIGTFDEEDSDGTYYWVEWEDPSCGVLGASRVGEVENFEVNRSNSEVVGVGEAAGCRGHLRPYAATTRHPGARPSVGHRAGPASENMSSRHLGEYGQEEGPEPLREV